MLGSLTALKLHGLGVCLICTLEYLATLYAALAQVASH